VAQGSFQYRLTVDSRQYKRELSEASKLAGNLASSLDKSVKSQKTNLDALRDKISKTNREFVQLNFLARSTPSGELFKTAADNISRLNIKLKETQANLSDSEKDAKSFERALGRLSKLDPSQIRRAQVMADPDRAAGDLSKQNRRNKATLLTLNKVSEQLRTATVEQKRLNQAGLDTARVDLEIAKLVDTHARLNTALDRGVKSAGRLEAELQDVARQQKILGSTQYNAPIGPAAPQRGFGGNTGRRAAVGGFFRAGLAQRGGLAGAAVSGGAAGAAAVGASAVIEAFGRLTQATAAYANGAAQAAAQTRKLELALQGTLGAEEATEGFKTIQGVVEDFNVPFNTAAKQFTRFSAAAKASGVSTEEIENSFRGLIAANKALGGSQDQANGILLAATQVFSKGKVAAEELRGQIGERLSGSVALFAKSMGVTTAKLDKLLEQGVVSVADFVKFAGEELLTFEKSAEKISDSPAEAGARLAVQLEELQRNIGNILGPIGAEFQKVFGEIVTIINKAIKALNNFLGLGTEGALAKVERDLEDAEQRVLDNLSGNTDDKGDFRRVSRLGQARADVLRLREDRQKLLGQQEGTIEKGDLVTSDILKENRKGKGKGTAVDPAVEAARVAKIRAANARRLAEATSKQALAFEEQRAALGRRLDQERQQLVLANLSGVARAQQQINNAYQTQNAAIQAQAEQLDRAVTEAQNKLDAAKAELLTAGTDTDKARLEGRIAVLEAALQGAGDRRDQFADVRPQLEQNAAETAVAASTQSFRDRAEAANLEAQALQERNRLMMEGFTPEQIETQLKLSEINRQEAEQLSQLNPAIEEQARQMDAVKDAANAAREAIEGLARQQTELAKTTRAFKLMGDVANTVGSAISVAFTQGFADIVTGSKTVNEVLGNLFQSIGQSFLQMAAKIIQEMITMFLLQSLLKVFGSAASAGSSAAPAAPASKYGSAGNLAGPTGDFGLGSGPSMAIPSHMQNPQLVSGFANGGLVTKPTLGLVGEGKYNEAIVPLPDGRSIPVDFRGGDDRLSKMMGKGQSGVAAPQMNFTFETTNIGGTEYVSREQLESAMAVTRKQAANDGAKRGMSMTLDKMQNSPRTRSRIGI